MTKKLLIINTCKEKLHYYEFVKPVEEIVSKIGISFFTKSYKEISDEDIEKSSSVIICGTSLKDNDFLENVDAFSWIKNFDEPVLGICAGMQIISLLYGGTVKNKTEIGFYVEDFKKKFLKLNGKQEVYHLHNNYVSLPKDFIKFTNSKIPQAIKHKTKNIFGVLFHPEVRQKEIIENFVRI